MLHYDKSKPVPNKPFLVSIWVINIGSKTEESFAWVSMLLEYISIRIELEFDYQEGLSMTVNTFCVPLSQSSQTMLIIILQNTSKIF